MGEHNVQQTENVIGSTEQNGTEIEVKTTELQTSEDVILKLDEVQSSIEHVSIMLVIIFSFFAGFMVARTAVEAFFRTWK